MATIDIYDKGQVDALLQAKADTADLPSASELMPDYSGASADDVLTIENGAPVWKAGGSGSGQIITQTFGSVENMLAWMASNISLNDKMLYMKFTSNASDNRYVELYDGAFYNIESGKIYCSCMGYYKVASAAASNPYTVPPCIFNTSAEKITVYIGTASGAVGIVRASDSERNIPNGTTGTTGSCTLTIQKA